jgi:hypothetical protein
MRCCFANANSQRHKRLRRGLRAERADTRHAVCHRDDLGNDFYVGGHLGNDFYASRRVLKPGNPLRGILRTYVWRDYALVLCTACVVVDVDSFEWVVGEK